MDHGGFKPKLHIGGVPLHAMLVSFPVACFTGALLTDLAYLESDGQVQWANFSQWLLAVGEFTGVLAAICGLVDLLGNPAHLRPKSAWLHMIGSATVLTLGLFNNLVHARDGWTGVMPTGITLSAITFAVLAITAFLGLRLAYGHSHGNHA